MERPELARFNLWKEAEALAKLVEQDGDLDRNAVMLALHRVNEAYIDWRYYSE